MESFLLSGKDSIIPSSDGTNTDHLRSNRAYRERWLRMKARWNDEFEHMQAKGESNETVVRKLLREYLPEKYGVTEGFLIDRKGRQSKQTDVIIYDRFSHPFVFFEAPDDSDETHKIIPIDSVIATIEVKTTLKGHLEEGFKNISYSRANLMAINQLMMPAQWGEHFYTGSPSSFIFAFRGGWANRESIKNSVRSAIKNARIDPKHLFDLLYVQEEEVTLGWVYGFERDRFLVRPCDHWQKPLYLTEITPGDSEGLALYHFLSQVAVFVTRFQLPELDRLLYHYGPPIEMNYSTDEEPVLVPNGNDEKSS
jgi:hypothetical protein